jgi:predicted DNA-binding transcriptional regulator YafY
VDKSNAPYVITKPIHPSQKVLEKNDEGIVISLAVQINFELEREILGFGESMTVLKPDRLRTRIRQKLEWALSRYRLDE